MGKTHMDRVAFIDHLERKYSQKVRQHKQSEYEQSTMPAPDKRRYGDRVLLYEMIDL